MIQPQNKNHLIHLSIALVALFFCFRELGTFPSAWLDDSLFMLVAQSLVRGEGYALPMLTSSWEFPFMLAVGPTVILPPATSMMLFGQTVWAARLPAALYTLATTFALFVFARERKALWNAQGAALLLVTLSAFINNGKPVLGEVPALLFLFCALLFLTRMKTVRDAVFVGILLGVTAVSKLTFSLVFPALFIAFLVSLWKRDRKTSAQLVVAGIVSFVLFAVWQYIEISSQPGVLEEIRHYGLAEDGSQIFKILRENPSHLLRFPFLYFATLFVFAGVGLTKVRHTLSRSTIVFIVSLVGLFTLYFLNGPGWYRHLLPAHVLLLPFVPVGMWALLGKRISVALLIFFVVAQGWWQLTYHGATRSPEAVNAAMIIQEYPYEQIVIENPEVYFRLPDSDKYLFTSREYIRTYLDFGLPFTQEEHCLPVVRKVGFHEREQYGDRLIELAWRFVIIEPEDDCES